MEKWQVERFSIIISCISSAGTCPWENKKKQSVSHAELSGKASVARTEKEKSDFTYCKKINNCADQILRVQRQINKKKIK